MTSLLKALTTVFSNQHYAVEVATDGQAGWDLVEAFAYDLILLDVMLPKLDRWPLPTPAIAWLSNADSVANRSEQSR